MLLGLVLIVINLLGMWDAHICGEEAAFKGLAGVKAGKGAGFTDGPEYLLRGGRVDGKVIDGFVKGALFSEGRLGEHAVDLGIVING